MSQTLYAMLASTGLLLMLSGLGAVLAIRLCERRMAPRIQTLEDALRVYNSANANLGRHLTLLESELRDLRQHTVLLQEGTAPLRLRERIQQAHSWSRAGAESQPDSVPGVAGSVTQSVCNAAETRLARLISARLHASTAPQAAATQSG